MTTTQQRTRAQIRQSIGFITGAIDHSGGTASLTPSIASNNAAQIEADIFQFGAEDEHRGKWVLATDSNSSTYIRQVVSSDPEGRTVTVASPFPRVTDTGWTFELWEEHVNPALIHDAINQAISETTRKDAQPLVLDSLHTGGNIREFDLSSTCIGVKTVQWRQTWTGEELETFDNALSSLTSNVTIINDSEDYREGMGSNRFTIAAGMSSATEFAISSFATAKDLSGYTHIEQWFKANAAVTSSAFTVDLYEGSSEKESLSVPALDADEWTYVTTALANPESDSGITSLRLATGSSDMGAVTIWSDRAEVVRQRAETYTELPRKFWYLDSSNNRLVISNEMKLPYAKLRVTGVRRPNLLTTDTAVCEIDSQYVLNSVAAKVLRATGDRDANNRDAAWVQADQYEALAQAIRVRGGAPQGIRWL